MSATTASSPRLVELARLGVSLRWRLVNNRARRLGKRTRVFAYVLGAAYALGNIVGLASVRFAGDLAAERTLVLLAASMASGWIFGPILIGGVDETVDPTRLALLPLRRRQLFTVQLAGALSGAGPLAVLCGLAVGVPLGFTTSVVGGVLSFGAAVVLVLMVAGLARSAAAVLAIAQRSRIGRDLAVLAAALSAGALFVVGQLATSFSEERAAALVDALQWAPFGWPTRVAIDARAGDLASATLWLAISAAGAAAALALWAQLSQFLLTNGERVVRTGRRGRGAALNGADSVFGATLARQWIYLRRSPNTRVALMFGLAFGVAFPVLQIFQHGADESSIAAFSVLLAMLANVGATSNLLGFDAGSLWIDALTGGPGRPHMAARSVTVLPNLLLPTWFSAVVVGVWTGQWRAIAVVALLAIPVALLVLAQGLVTSLLAPWPLPDGDNPFGNRQAAEGRGGRLAATALSGLACAVVAATPLLIAAYVGIDQRWVWFVPAVGMVWALAVGWAVLRWVGHHLDANRIDLVERLSPIALN